MCSASSSADYDRHGGGLTYRFNISEECTTSFSSVEVCLMWAQNILPNTRCPSTRLPGTITCILYSEKKTYRQVRSKFCMPTKLIWNITKNFEEVIKNCNLCAQSLCSKSLLNMVYSAAALPAGVLKEQIRIST